MRTLYTFDKHNYSDDMEVFERFAVRAVIIRDGKLAMQQAGEGVLQDTGRRHRCRRDQRGGAGTGGARGGRASRRAGKHRGSAVRS